MPKITIIEIIELILILIILVFLIRNLWSILYDKSYRPVTWIRQVKQGKVPKKLIKLERKYPDKIRFYNIWFQIERIKRDRVEGAFAELGVYKGEMARIIHLCDPSRTFHLFDTFSGFTSYDLTPETGEAATYSTRNFADTSIEKAKRIIGGNDNLVFHQGYFPETTSGLENEKYAFVNIDVDLYNPIKAGLEYFYPRLSPGGVIIVHDYNYKWEGAMKAVNEYVAQIKENIIPVADKQCSVMIMKNKWNKAESIKPQ